MNRVEPNRNVYVGHRYVPLLVGEWDKSIQYEGLSIVTFKGASYTSKKMTPPGIDIENEEYWVLTGNYDAQVEYYRQDVERYRDEVQDMGQYVDDETASTRQYVDDETSTTRQYVDTNVNDLKRDVNNSISDSERKINETVDNVNQELSKKGNIHDVFEVDGVDDYSEILNDAFQNYSNINIKNGFYPVDVSKMLPIKSDTLINFEPNAKIKALPNDLERVYLLDINDVKNVVINYPNLEGDKHEHLDDAGQWGHGINIDSSENIIINHPTCNKFWGDGIYIRNTKNLKIIDAYCDDNRRQGISLISGENVDIVRPICINTGGQNPGAGLDIEPNYNDDHLININVYHPYFRDNGNTTSYDYGFVISLANRGEFHRNVDINIYNPNIPVGAIVIGAAEMSRGEVNIIEPVIKNSEDAGILVSNRSDDLQVNIIRPKIINPNRKDRNSIYVAGIKMQVDDDYDSNYDGIKNIKIVEPEIITDNIKTFAIRITDVNNQTENNLKNVEIIRPKTSGFNDIFGIHRSSTTIIKPDKTFKLEYGQDFEKLVLTNFGSGIGDDLQRANVIYRGDNEASDVGALPIYERLPVTNVEITIENDLLKPLEVRFTNTANIDYSPKKVYPVSNDDLNGVRLPNRFSWVKMLKISETEFKIIDSSGDIEPIPTT